jgi:hypothetical protein
MKNKEILSEERNHLINELKIANNTLGAFIGKIKSHCWEISERRKVADLTLIVVKNLEILLDGDDELLSIRSSLEAEIARTDNQWK